MTHNARRAAVLVGHLTASGGITTLPTSNTNTPSYTCILSETRGKVGLVTLNRPKVLNALSPTLLGELVDALQRFDADPAVGCIVITGSGNKAFSAGADIDDLSTRNFVNYYMSRARDPWAEMLAIKKPIIAAINGFALGGGCELAMICDIMIASDKARFGQPEIKIGTIPGAGGTQRLVHAIGKSRAMELNLTGDLMDAAEAERKGLVSRVVPADQLLDSALKTASKIASMSKPIAALTKEAVNGANELPLSQGLVLEKRLHQATFAVADQREGMRAFLAKRKPEWKDE